MDDNLLIELSVCSIDRETAVTCTSGHFNQVIFAVHACMTTNLYCLLQMSEPNWDASVHVYNGGTPTIKFYVGYTSLSHYKPSTLTQAMSPQGDLHWHRNISHFQLTLR